MQRAAQTGDFAAFQTAKEQYAQSFDLEQAKHRAAKVRVQNRINAIDNDVKAEISNAETSVKAQTSATAIDNGLNTAAAGTEGRVTDAGSAARDTDIEAKGRESILGNAVQDEAQGQSAASTVAGNSGILDQEETGSVQGPGEGAGESIISAGNKATAIKLVDELTPVIQSKVKNFFKGGSNSYTDFSVSSSEDGSYIVKMIKPGNVPGSKAIYYKVIDSRGNTIRVYKETYDQAGNLVHIKDK